MMYKKRVVFWAACAGMLLFGISIITLGSVATELRDKLKAHTSSSLETTIENRIR